MNLLKIIGFVLSATTLFGCGSSSDSLNTPSDDLIGDWSYTYPNQCEEVNSFSSIGAWNESALDEIQSGTYLFVESVAGDKHSLTVNILEDNGLSDCNGRSEIRTGSSVTVYAVFPSDTTMEWYLSESDESPAVTLTKK